MSGESTNIAFCSYILIWTLCCYYQKKTWKSLRDETLSCWWQRRGGHTVCAQFSPAGTQRRDNAVVSEEGNFPSSVNSTQSFKSSIEVVLQKIHYQRPLLELNHIFLIYWAAVKWGLQTLVFPCVSCSYFHLLAWLTLCVMLGRSANKPRLKVSQYWSFSQLSEKHLVKVMQHYP